MPLRMGGAWRKRWRYVGAFGRDAMVCVAAAEVGPVATEFWGVWDRRESHMSEGTRRLVPGRRRTVAFNGGPVARARSAARGPGSPQTVSVRSRDLELDLTLGTGEPIESICPNGFGAYVWTRKLAGVAAAGEVRLRDGRVLSLDGVGVIDDSAGYHARRTSWLWSAGGGIAADGRAIGWNLVEGVNDPPAGSERAVWLDGEHYEPGPVSFDGLDAVAFDGGSRMGFTGEGERTRSESLGPLLRSSYRAPFGSFHGELDGIAISSALGVMEQHDAVW